MRVLMIVLAMLAAVACKPKVPLRPAADPRLARLLPSDPVAVAGVRMEELKRTPVYRDLLDPRMPRLAETLGFDLRQGVRELLVSWDEKGLLIVAGGHFEEPAGAAPEPPYHGHGLSRLSAGVFGRVNPDTAVIGPRGAVEAVIDRSGNRKAAAPPLIERAPADSFQIWAVARGDGLLTIVPDAGNAKNFRQLLRGVDWLTLTGDMRSGIQAVLAAHCRSEAEAARLADTSRGLLSLSRLAAPRNQPEWDRVFDSVRVTPQGLDVRAEAAMPAEAAKRLLQ